MLDTIINIFLLLGLLLILVILRGIDKKIARFIAEIEKRQEMSREQVEKEMDELNEINEQ